MHTITYQHHLPASAQRAWAVFAKFEDLLVWHPLDLELEVQGQGIGMVRTLVIPSFGRVGERLDLLDHSQRRLIYTLVEGQPLGMQTYTAAIHFLEPEVANASVDSGHAEHGCQIHWEGQFTTASGADEDKVGTSLQGSYVGMSESLARYLSGNN